jgi:hypothetical protein
MKFCLRHSALQAKQNSVVKVAWIVESVLIEDEGVGECADFQEPVPVRGVACQSRDFQAEHDLFLSKKACSPQNEIRC